MAEYHVEVRTWAWAPGVKSDVLRFEARSDNAAILLALRWFGKATTNFKLYLGDIEVYNFMPDWQKSI